MKADNPLDRHLEVNTRMPHGLRGAAIEVADLLDLAWLTTQSVFEDKASPEIALGVFDRLVSHWKASPGPRTDSRE